MATFVLTNAYVSVGGTDLSDHIKSVTITESATEIDASVMGDEAIRRLAGARDVQATITFASDFAASKVDAKLTAALGVSTAIAIRPVNTTIGSTNPELQFNGMLFEHPIVDNSYNEEATVSATFKNADGAALVRDTTP